MTRFAAVEPSGSEPASCPCRTSRVWPASRGVWARRCRRWPSAPPARQPRPLPDQRIALAMVGAALGMADDDGLGTGVGQHFSREIAGVRARRIGVAILRADGEASRPSPSRRKAATKVAGGQTSKSPLAATRPLPPAWPRTRTSRPSAHSFSSCRRSGAGWRRHVEFPTGGGCGTASRGQAQFQIAISRH